MNKYVPSFIEITIQWFEQNSIMAIGLIMTVLGLVLTISEFRVYYKHRSSTEQLRMWLMFFMAGLATFLFNDLVFGALLGISILMVVETIKLQDVPVWGKLMMATTASYMVILLGKIMQMIYNNIISPDKPNDQYFSGALNFSIYVFIAVAFYYFGKKFILVSRLSSPQMIYLFLFGVIYVFIARFFPRDENNYLQSFNYLGIDGEWRKYVLFADFGTYETLIIFMFFMYAISGWLLTVLFGVKPVTDEEILRKVREVAKTMGIKEEIKVGYLKAPILNAFAYGPWFDKRIAFISNDINEFTDSDIRGIVGHELAHAANHHVFLLLLLSVAELGVKKALGLPATTLDYTFIPDTAVLKLDFVGYYIFSYFLVIILLIFVRILEGHADKCTKDAGYSQDLAQALYRLEGFYNGVASDFGISVNLLTNRTYTPAEKKRFTAQAARNLYREVLMPSKSAAFANIFQSHPRTAYRIASLVRDDLDPIKAAFLPYRLLTPKLRKGGVKILNEIREPYHEIIDETYRIDYGEEALEEVLEYNPWKEPYQYLIGKRVIAFNPFDKTVHEGILESLINSGRASSPFYGIIDGQEVDLALVELKEFTPDEDYYLKNGDILTAKGHEIDDKKGLLIVGQLKSGEEKKIKLRQLGVQTQYLKNLEGEEIIMYEKGISKLVTLDALSEADSFKDSILTIDGTEIKGSELIVSFPPIGVEIRKEYVDDQMPMLNYLIGKKVLMYTKDNYDVTLAGKITAVNKENIVFEDADGDHEVTYDRLEYLIFNEQIVELIVREHVSLFTKFSFWWSNRKEFSYIL